MVTYSLAPHERVDSRNKAGGLVELDVMVAVLDLEESDPRGARIQLLHCEVELIRWQWHVRGLDIQHGKRNVEPWKIRAQVGQDELVHCVRNGPPVAGSGILQQLLPIRLAPRHRRYH